MPITSLGSSTDSSIDGTAATVDYTTFSPSLQEGDLVIICICSSAGTASFASYTPIYTVNTTTILGVGYKFMTSTPDTSGNSWDPGGTSDSVAAVAFAFRGVDMNTPLDGVTPTTVDTSAVPNAPSIVPASDDCVVFICGGRSNSLDTTPGTVTNYTLASTSANDTNDATISAGYRILSGQAGVSQDPPAWSSWTSGNYSAVSCVLRPAVGHPAAKRMGGIPYASRLIGKPGIRIW